MEGKKADDIWIISEGRPVNLDLSNICKEPVSNQATEYRISELAVYLLNPNPVNVEEKVVGCRIKYRKSASGKMRRLMNKLPAKENPYIEEIMSNSKLGTPAFKDEALNAHLMKISELLRPYEPVQKKLAGLDMEKIEDVKAVCEDISGSRYRLNIRGDIREKINYVAQSLAKTVKVVLPRPYLLNGLFEMRGFNFQTFNAHNYFLLIKFIRSGRAGYCVLNSRYQLEYMVDDDRLISFMHVFGQSVKADPKLRNAVALCIKGDALPLKLFFSEKLEHSYSEKYLPLTYRSVSDLYEVNPEEKETITNMLNCRQSIVTFNYVPNYELGKKKVVINVSVMHDVRALEPIKGRLPQLYSEIVGKAPESDAVRLYLLDSMTGYQYV
ncbi:MAG: hypothetical protein HZA14_09015 [Nitrospirae bacterium]|nr:hypothetical protein [Nitrospirota bacterium]